MSAESDAFYTLINKIMAQYPAAIPLLQQPGVLQVYLQAIQEGWNGDRIEAALENTDWWKNTPAATRQWQALQATDPQTAHEKIVDTANIVTDLMRRLGLNPGKGDPSKGLLGDPTFQFVMHAVEEGWNADEIKYHMLATVGTSYSGGEVGDNAVVVRQMADEYGVPLTDKFVIEAAMKLTQGAITTDTVKGDLINRAKWRFPWLSDVIDKGFTIRQYADQYLQVLQQETGANVATMSMSDPKILAALDQVDPNTGQHSSMSASDWLAKIRTDPMYGYDQSVNGRAQATNLTTALAQKFGVTG